MCFQPASAPGCCAPPTERKPNRETSGYKLLALLGRNPTGRRRLFNLGYDQRDVIMLWGLALPL
jgi:hypothetical protein